MFWETAVQVIPHFPRFDVAGSSLLLGQGMLKGTPDWS